MRRLAKKKGKVKAQDESGSSQSQGQLKIESTRPKKMSKLREKIDMYDMILANILAGNGIIEPSHQLKSTEIEIGFSNIASESQISKYFMIRQFPDYLRPQLMDQIRRNCLQDGVKINFYIYCFPYRISWESAEMRNKMSIWKQYVEENPNDSDVFGYRAGRSGDLAKRRIVKSVKYLNEAELDHKRSLVRASFLVVVSAHRDDESLSNMAESIRRLKEFCSQSEIKLRELRINLLDWMHAFGIFSQISQKEVDTRISRKILTDDILANFNGYKQGRVGTTGIPLGMDISSGSPVLKKIKANPEAAENWLIAAETGGGKSMFVKSLLAWLLADNFVVTIMDYEGDEYSNFAAYVRNGNPEDVKVISMGKGSTVYFDPLEIPELTGDPEVDDDAKETSISYIMAIFRIIVCGTDGELSQWEEKVISTAISRVYDCAGVTNDKSTWHKSKGLRLKDVYEEMKIMVESKELVDSDSDNVKHKAAMRVVEYCSIYFEYGEAKSGTFLNPMSVNELYKAKLIIFSFGQKGAVDSQTDPVTLALKQLSVASVTIQISNHCKYVRHCFNVKVFEEFQRWLNVKGSSEIICNTITGGRKRGDVNFIITNDLANILDENDVVSRRIRQNIQNLAIGNIKSSDVRKDFCRLFSQQECEPALYKIARATMSDDKASKTPTNRYQYAFCIILDNGKKAIVRSRLPDSLVKSKLFKTGVDIGDSKQL